MVIKLAANGSQIIDTLGTSLSNVVSGNTSNVTVTHDANGTAQVDLSVVNLSLANLIVTNNATIGNVVSIGNLTFEGSFPSPTFGKLIIGDGSGWHFYFANSNTNLIDFSDTGEVTFTYGAVGIGNTNPSALGFGHVLVLESPRIRMDLVSTGNANNAGYRWQVQNTAGSEQSLGIYGVPSDTGLNQYVGIAADDQNYQLTVSANGQVTIPFLTASTGTTVIESGGTLYSLTSSIDYKIDVEDVNEQALINVMKLRPVWYRSNTETTSDRADFSWYGLIAEEVHEIDPRLVHYWDQGRGDRGLKPKSVAYERLAVLLIPVIRKQQKTIDDLMLRLERLEAVCSTMNISR